MTTNQQRFTHYMAVAAMTPEQYVYSLWYDGLPMLAHCVARYHRIVVTIY